jgi:hypothetical protein
MELRRNTFMVWWPCPEVKPSSYTFDVPGRPGAVTTQLTPVDVPFNHPATVRRLEGALGYVEIPGVVGGGDAFDSDAVAAIRAIDTRPICGVDR